MVIKYGAMRLVVIDSKSAAVGFELTGLSDNCYLQAAQCYTTPYLKNAARIADQGVAYSNVVFKVTVSNNYFIVSDLAAITVVFTGYYPQPTASLS